MSPELDLGGQALSVVYFFIIKGPKNLHDKLICTLDYKIACL